VLAIVHEPLANEWVVLQERGRAIPNQKVDGRLGKGAAKILEQCRRQHHVTQASQLNEEHLTRSRDARRLHSGSRHSFAYCTKA
jgi:hypothetical protein